MALAFIVGALFGGLVGGLYMRYLMYEQSYRDGIEHNRRMQQLLNDQYNLGIQRGISETRKTFIERDTARDNMLVIAGVIAGYFDANSTISLPSGTDAEDAVATYITNITNNYREDYYNVPFRDYVTSLLIRAFGVTSNG